MLRSLRLLSRNCRRAVRLATVAVIVTTGSLVLLPTPVYASRVTTHIDQESPALSVTAPPVATDPGSDPSQRVAGRAGPLTPDEAQQRGTAEQAGRLRGSSVGIAAFSLIGVSARTPNQQPVLVRVRHGSDWAAWIPLAFDGGDAPDPSSTEARRAAKATHGLPTTDGIWVGAADGYEISLPPASDGLVVHLARESITTEPAVVESTAGAAPVNGNQPAIAPRSAWGARPPKEDYSYAPTVEHAVVHHSVTQNVYSPADVPGILRSIQAFHMDARGWNDIAYNFAVDKFGGVWEARGGGITRAVIGGHALGANTGTTGVVALGDFSTALPPQAMVDSIGDIVGWKLGVHGTNPSQSSDYRIGATDRYAEGTHLMLPAVIGHLDVGATGCPGDFLYPRLAEIRGRAAAKWAQLNFVLLRSNQLGSGAADATPRYSLPGGKRLVCDWNGDGVDTPATMADGIWYITDNPNGGGATRIIGYGIAGDIPVCGDWNGDGVDTPGIVRNGIWYLVNTLGKPAADVVVAYGLSTDVPIVGDWNGDGTATPGIIRNGIWYLVNTLGKPAADVVVAYGLSTDVPIVGDWNGDGTTTPGIIRNGIWYLVNTLGQPTADVVFAYGYFDDQAIVGDWNGDRKDSAGVIRFP
jgi:hypothetical protein